MRDLHRDRNHMLAELAAGQRLTQPEDTERYGYDITSSEPAMGCGWNLRLLDGEIEAGTGVFPVKQDATACALWWNGILEDEREWWLIRAVERGAAPLAAEAYLIYLIANAYADAETVAYNWLDSRG